MAVTEGDVSRLFLQAVISRRYLSDDLAKALCKKSVSAVKEANDSIHINYSSAYFDELITKVNRALESLHLELRSVRDEDTGKLMWALVNNKGDEISQSASFYNAAEIAYFRLVVEQIVLAPNESFSLSSMAALRETNQLSKQQHLTKTQAEVALGSFVARGWLSKSQKGRYSLGTRTIMELGNYLKQTYDEDILECTSCMEIVTKGIACYRPNCQTRFHNHCAAVWRQRTNVVCPSCKIDWTDAEKLKKVGEEAAPSGGDDRRRTRRGEDDDDDDDEEEELDATQDMTQDQSNEDEEEQTQPIKSRSKRKAKAPTVETDDEDDEEVSSPPKKNNRSNGRRR